MAVAEVSIVPLGTGSASLSRYVAEAIKVLKSFKELRVEVTSMATILEADSLDDIFNAVKAAREAVFALGVNRVLTQVKIDERRDKQISIKSKLNSVNRQLKND